MSTISPPFLFKPSPSKSLILLLQACIFIFERPFCWRKGREKDPVFEVVVTGGSHNLTSVATQSKEGSDSEEGVAEFNLHWLVFRVFVTLIGFHIFLHFLGPILYEIKRMKRSKPNCDGRVRFCSCHDTYWPTVLLIVEKIKKLWYYLQHSFLYDFKNKI